MNPRGTSTDLMNALTIETGPGPSVGFLQPDRQMSQDSGAGSVMSTRSMSNSSYTAVSEDYDVVGVHDIVFPSFATAHRLGHGSYGSVIEVTFKNQRAALKLLTSNASYKEVNSEAKMISSFDHKNIIKLYAVYKNNDQTGLLLELMLGGSLHQLLHNHRQVRFYADHALGWAYQCIAALHYIHSKGYLHRDIKPSNMLLSDNFIDLKLCDFGTAANQRTTMTNNRGSAAYMSPEVFKQQKYNQKCDIYSFAISFWEILARRFPFEYSDPLTIQWQVTMSDLRPQRLDQTKIPGPLVDLIERCWHKNPIERPEAEEAMAIIEIIMESCGNRFKPLIDMTTNKQAIASRLNDPIPVNISAPGGLDEYAGANMQHGNKPSGFGPASDGRSADGPPPVPPRPDFTHRRATSGAYPGYPSSTTTDSGTYTPMPEANMSWINGSQSPIASSSNNPPPPYPLIPIMPTPPLNIGFNVGNNGYTPPYQPQPPVFTPSPSIQAPLPLTNDLYRRTSEPHGMGNGYSSGDSSPNGTECRKPKKKHSGTLAKIFSRH